MSVFLSSYRSLYFTASALLISAALYFFSPAVLFAADSFSEFSLGFGTAENQVMYYNNTIKDFEEAYPMGPADFCVLSAERAAVLDSFNNSVKIFNNNSKLIEVIDILKIVEKELATAEIALSAFAFAGYDDKNGAEFYVADAISSKIFHISASKLIKTIGGRGDKAFEFTQIEQLFLTPSGSLLVCDYALNKAAVYDTASGAWLKEYSWNLCSIYADSEYIYSINPRSDKSYVFYRQNLKTGYVETMFSVRMPDYRIAKIIGVDKNNGVMAAFFDDSIQNALIESNNGEYPAGYYTIALFTGSGQLAASKNIPVCAPLGNQFYYNASLSAAYFQNYNSDRAPSGDYKISCIEPGFEELLKVKKSVPDNMFSLKKFVTKIEYGDETNKITGGPVLAKDRTPILRCDKYGYFYILDRNAGKVLCVDEAFANIKAVEIIKNISAGEGSETGGDRENVRKSGGTEYDFCDLFAVSSAEVYVLDSKNGKYYHIKSSAVSESKSSGTASYDIKVVEYDEKSEDRYDRIYANAIGDVMLYSTIDGDSIYFDEKGSEKKAADSINGGGFFVMGNSDIIAQSQNETSGEVVLRYMDFYGNIMQRFISAPTIKTAGVNISASHIIGVDENINVFMSYFNGTVQKIVVFSVTGDKVCDFNFNAPGINRYFESSMACGAKGVIYAGLPLEDAYYVVRLPYSSIIEYITKK